MTSNDTAVHGREVVLYDGSCGMCSDFVAFVIQRDPTGIFAFAALQSELGSELLRPYAHGPSSLTSIVLFQLGAYHNKSDAVLRIFAKLQGPIRLFRHGMWLPRRLRDVVYDFIAARQHRLRRRAPSCAIIAASAQARILS